MDTSDPKIVFDETGTCNHCSEFLNKRANHQYQSDLENPELERIVAKMKKDGKGKKYDCISGMSGGIDSCYLAYIAKQKGLRVLAVHMDNGWNSDSAVLNIKNVTGKLGIDYESYVLDWEEFREIQLAFLKASVPEADTPSDMAIAAVLHKVAAKHGVKHILMGGNISTEGILPAAWHYDAKDIKYFNHILRTFGKMKLSHFPTFSFKKEIYYKLVKGIKLVYLLNHVKYVSEDITSTAQEELGWKHYGGKHHESRYTKFIQSYYLFTKFGIDYRKATLSSQICLGDISRECAIGQLEKKPYDSSEIGDEIKYISKKLRITENELDRIIKQPARWSWEYPNDEKKLKFIYDTYRRIYKKEKLASF